MELKYSQIYTIGPSKIEALLNCPLKVVFSVTSGRSKSFSGTPSSIIGEVIHDFFNEVIQAGNYEQSYLLELWNEIYREYENEFVKSEINKKYLPLDYWIPFYSIKKKLAIDFALKLKTLIGQCRPYCEEPLEIDFIKGRFDLAIECGDEWDLKDYKTGPIYNYKKGHKTTVKSVYIDQLKTYGLLLSKSKGIKANKIRLSLIQISGIESQKFSFTEEEYDTHHATIINTIKEVNSKIISDEAQKLGNPTEENCMYCNYRMSCNNYKMKIKNGVFLADSSIYLSNFKTEQRGEKINISFYYKGITNFLKNIPEDDFKKIEFLKSQGYGIYALNLSHNQSTNVYYWKPYTIFFY